MHAGLTRGGVRLLVLHPPSRFTSRETEAQDSEGTRHHPTICHSREPSESLPISCSPIVTRDSGTLGSWQRLVPPMLEFKYKSTASSTHLRVSWDPAQILLLNEVINCGAVPSFLC